MKQANILKTMNLRHWIVPFIICITGCSPNIPFTNKYYRKQVPEQELNKLAQQLRGEACYWNSLGEKAKSREWLSLLPKSSYVSKCQRDAANILRSLAEGGSPLQSAVPILIEGLRIIPASGESAEALGYIKDSKAIDSLVETLNMNNVCWENPEKKCSFQKKLKPSFLPISAIDALGQIGVSKPEVIELLLQGLKHEDKDERINISSAFALSQLDVDKVLPNTIKMLQVEKNPRTKSFIIKIFSDGAEAYKKKDDIIIPYLVQEMNYPTSLNSSTPEVRKYRTNIVNFFAKIKTSKSINALRELSKSSDSEISELAKKALAVSP